MKKYKCPKCFRIRFAPNSTVIKICPGCVEPMDEIEEGKEEEDDGED